MEMGEVAAGGAKARKSCLLWKAAVWSARVDLKFWRTTNGGAVGDSRGGRMDPGAKSGHRGQGQGELNAGPPGDLSAETHMQALVPLLQATPCAGIQNLCAWCGQPFHLPHHPSSPIEPRPESLWE